MESDSTGQEYMYMDVTILLVSFCSYFHKYVNLQKQEPIAEGANIDKITNYTGTYTGKAEGKANEFTKKNNAQNYNNL